MNEDKFIKMQMQMKQNNEDYRDFVEGLDSWSREVSEKEKKLVDSNNKTAEKANKNQFPIRNSVIREKKAKIKAYDYAAWDKFDVDKHLAEETISGSSEMQLEELVREHREAGNLRFREGAFREATAEYTRALFYKDSEALLYCNRALSLLREGLWEAAEVDCCKALELEPRCVKALYRRSLCREALQRPEEALGDLYSLLEVEPGNTAALNCIRKLEREVRGTVEPLFGAPKKGRESSKPLYRVNIIDVNPDKQFPIIPEKINNSDDTDIKINKLNEKADNSEKINKINKKIDNSGEINKINENKRKFKDDNEEEEKSFVSPSTALQLIKDLSKLRRNPLNKAKYISNIDDNQYRKLIGHSLDCRLLADFIDGICVSLRNNIINETQFVEKINHLSVVNRFSSLWMMMTEEDKCVYRETVASLEPHTAASLKVSS